METGTILVADDEEITRKTVETILKQEGHTVAFAENGEEAVQQAEALLPDAVILDVVMPKVDGYEACRRLKSNPKMAHIPVLLATVLTQRKERLTGIKAGANDFLTKPLDPTDLKLRVRNAVHNKHLYDQLQRSFDQLKKLEELRDNLTQMIVHDMRSPLTALLGSLDLFLSRVASKLTAQESDSLQRAYQSARRLCNMVGDLLDVSRLEAGEMPLNRTAGDLAKMAEEAIRPLEFLIGKRDFDCSLPETPLEVVCDVDLIQRVIGNLLANAFKYTPEEARVSLTVSQDAAWAKVVVADTGPGIPPEYYEKIFEKFGQVERKTMKRVGTGLGLTFCKLVVEAHGGAIGVASEVSKGSTFWFKLPRTAAPR